jgi:hypothetical protein
MRALGFASLICLALAGFGTPALAMADPTFPPEAPPGYRGVEFVDNPAIVDPHPMTIESWSRTGGDALAVHFTTGTPGCYGVHATVQETDQAVTVEFLGGTLPEAVGRACIMIAVSGTLDVPLQDPLGDRQVLSQY